MCDSSWPTTTLSGWVTMRDHARKGGIGNAYYQQSREWIDSVFWWQKDAQDLMTKSGVQCVPVSVISVQFGTTVNSKFCCSILAVFGYFFLAESPLWALVLRIQHTTFESKQNLAQIVLSLQHIASMKTCSRWHQGRVTLHAVCQHRSLKGHSS